MKRVRHILFGLCVWLACFAPSGTLDAQEAAVESVTVSAPEIPTSYGAPVAFSQSRFSPLVHAYVLPPGEVYTSLIYEGDAGHYRSPDHHFTEEIEVGLPYRINLAIEN